jgi:hypothetical protein
MSSNEEYKKPNGSVMNSLISNRVAAASKNTCDNDYKGNGYEIAHLLKYKPGLTNSQVGFETHLRRYTSTTG